MGTRAGARGEGGGTSTHLHKGWKEAIGRTATQPITTSNARHTPESMVSRPSAPLICGAYGAPTGR
eukprot:6025185-Prymnesium_polylepis.1